MKKSQVLKAFVHGDGNLLNNYPELQEALVWVYFHSNLPEFNRVECWGALNNAAAPPPPAAGAGGGRVEAHQDMRQVEPSSKWERPEEPCMENCTCCFPPMSLIPWSQDLAHENIHDTQKGLQQQTWPDDLYSLRVCRLLFTIFKHLHCYCKICCKM